ncbi:hypothetical protein [Flavobacterium hercynium]|uniref:Uncharacterized protein n=1 Tax=Flavobacterium hercynium TaxID=387094 RepID=A0A226GWU1_9FLAO|nr:hypothetical protein [Flavobacterium hercynium]OXA85921.1 hypothetical protein B0A66_18895 [Flavobacterium hercynium]SMP33967.1 hypothetical protein SAMN06265346_11764 [Flavobacterium hercynium]
MEITYINYLKKSVYRQIQEEIQLSKIDEVLNQYLIKHLVNRKPQKFQFFYFETINNEEFYLESNNFFKQFKSQYSLQGIDNEFLERLETKKIDILNLIKQNEIEKLYFDYFKNADLKRKDKLQSVDLTSFLAKLVHTFNPYDYCALDNPIRNHFKLNKESFYLSFLIISSQYKKWCEENQSIIQVIREDFKKLDSENVINFEKLTDLKLLDLIFWSKSN